MAERRRYPQLVDKTDEYIEQTFLNILTNADIYNLKALRDEIYKIVDDIPSVDESPSWFQSTLSKIVSIYSSQFPERNEPAPKINVPELYNSLIYDHDGEAKKHDIFYTIPFLQTYAATQKLSSTIDDNLATNPNIQSLVESSLKEKMKPTEELLNELSHLKASSSETLTLLNKEAGKIGVRKYATIFEDQARKHSFFTGIEGDENSTKRAWGFGSAQIWIVCSIVFIVGFGLMVKNLDDLFPIVGEKFTPITTVHLIGRVVSITSGIFLISFALKQYRINMHLSTLNQYRSNTLKSFEYFTKAPDNLDPASYNAMLMKVADSIYEAGQTGYISNTETNNDMPSIVDMTKIITPSGKS